MKLAIPIAVAVGDDGAVSHLRIELPEDLRDWTLAICALATGVVPRLHITNTNVELRLSLDATPRLRASGRAILEGRRVHILLSATELEMWQHFFLRAFRDGVPEVDHLDVELQVGNGDASIELVVALRSAAPPMSAKEAARMLRD